MAATPPALTMSLAKSGVWPKTRVSAIIPSLRGDPGVELTQNHHLKSSLPSTSEVHDTMWSSNMSKNIRKASNNSPENPARNLADAGGSVLSHELVNVLSEG